MARASRIVSPEHQELLRLEVIRSEQLSPHWKRVTFGGGDIDRFVARGYDQWFRLFLPAGGDDGDAAMTRIPARANKVFGYLKYLRIPEGVRPAMRNYTVRAYRAEGASGGPEIDVDFVLHGTGAHSGPASRWADAAAPGDTVVIIDEGLGFDPARGVEQVLLVADETGVPAVAGICASLPPEATGSAIVEVPTHDDILPFEAPVGVNVRWIVRDGAAKPGALALAALAEVPTPDPRTHAFIVGEQSLPVGARRHLVGQGLAKEQISFIGYWRTKGDAA